MALPSFRLPAAAPPAPSPSAPAASDATGVRVQAVPNMPGNRRAGFTRMDASRTGLDFANQLDDAALARNQILEVGSGVALGDVDGDGLVDVYLCSLSGTNRLYRNLGDWRFEDLTPVSGTACAGQFSTGAVLADVDGDRDLDLLVNGIGVGTRLFLNAGTGRFREARESGLVPRHGATSMALGDVDGDGWLDLYVATYHTRTVKDSPAPLDVEAGFVDGRFVIRPPGRFAPIFLRSGGVSLLELGEPDFFYRNRGRGVFAPVDWTDGTFVDAEGKALAEAPKDWGLAVAFRDLDGNGTPDLYVCNDFFQSLDQAWLNDGTGRFRPLPARALGHTSMSSMALDFADLDRDGWDDFLVLDMLSREHARRQRQRGSLVHVQAAVPWRVPDHRPEYPRNMLFRNRGDGTWAEIAQSAGLEATEWSWCIAFLDVDLDGYEDALVANGTVRDANDAELAQAGAGRMDGRGTARPGNLRFPVLETANLAFRNRGDLTFEERGRDWGFDTVGVSHGMALADLDNDGDLDVVVNHLRQPAGLYRNESTAARIAVRLLGRAPNTQGIGARVELLGGSVPRQAQEIQSGGRYLSGDDPVRVFAPGSQSTGLVLRVTWRAGGVSLVSNVLARARYEVQEPSDPPFPVPVPTPTGVANPSRSRPAPLPLFEDRSARLAQRHQENEFPPDDSQPSLPRSFDRPGPGLAWRDLDEDGWEDLVVGGARGGFGIVYLGERGGRGFRPTRRRDPLPRDQTAVLAVRHPRGHLELLAGSSSYEEPRKPGPTVVGYHLGTGVESEVIGSQPWSVGPLALGFVGTRQALFVGARVRPGRYPEPAPSRLYLRDDAGWTPDVVGTAVLATTGLATGATWADLDGDGQAELVVATEWGPIRAFRFTGSEARELTSELGLARYRGCWNGVAAGDFDEDGRLDLVASNRGTNTRYQRHRSRPIRLYWGDWLGTDRIDVLEAYHDPRLDRYVPFLPLDALRLVSPGLAARFPSFAAYAQAGIEAIVGDEAGPPRFLEADWFESTLLLNRGTRFEAHPLPSAAQWSPAHGVAVADVDGDGHEDVFLAQNDFDGDGENSRADAGRGLLLRGDGRGGFAALPPHEAGIQLPGEQRAAAFCDFDHDGRVDLAVGQNDGPVGLFRNARGAPGLRVHVHGPPWNPDAVGAVLRLRHGDRTGPARAVQLGSGFGSQNGPVQVLASPSPPAAVWIRWPGGRVSVENVPPGATEIHLRHGP